MIRVGIVGVGNCAKSLIEGIHYYRKNTQTEPFGLMHKEIGGYSVRDIDFVAAWDVDQRKVGKPLNDAMYQKPNCSWNILGNNPEFDSELSNPIVELSPVLDGVANHMVTDDIEHNGKVYLPTQDVMVNESELMKSISDKKIDVFLNYLPVGSQIATEFWVNVCLENKINMVNCIPIFIASDPEWGKKFKDAEISIIGDDMKSQVGASIISAVLQELFYSRGANVLMHYQDNIGGNTDFLNMQDSDRIVSKKISKENVIKNQTKLAGRKVVEHSTHAGPAEYFPSLGDNKRAHWVIKGTGFGGAPIEFTGDLSVQDSPNSAGVVIDALRLCKVANEMGLYGPLDGPSAWTQKTPPTDMKPADAKIQCDRLANRIVE